MRRTVAACGLIRWAAAAGVLALSLVACGCASTARSDDRPRRLDMIASRDSVRVVSLAVAPDAAAAAYLEEGGRLHIFGADGGEVSVLSIEGARMMAISGAARRLIVAGERRGDWWVRILETGGRTVWRQSVVGRVLSVTVSPDGGMAYTSTTGHRMYAFDVRKSPLWRRIHTERDLDRLQYDETVDALVARTLSPQGFGLVEPDGKTIWWVSEPFSTFDMECCAHGAMLLTTSARLSPEPTVEFCVYTAAGRKVFSRRWAGYEPRAALSSDGSLLAISYRRKLIHKETTVMERRIALWSVKGKRLWEQGGLFFKPVLLGFTEGPLGVLVAEDYSLLTGLDRYGRLAWRGPALRADVTRLVTDPSWQLAWARFQDNGLELWRIRE